MAIPTIPAHKSLRSDRSSTLTASLTLCELTSPRWNRRLGRKVRSFYRVAIFDVGDVEDVAVINDFGSLKDAADFFNGLS